MLVTHAYGQHIVDPLNSNLSLLVAENLGRSELVDDIDNERYITDTTRFPPHTGFNQDRILICFKSFKKMFNFPKSV